MKTRITFTITVILFSVCCVCNVSKAAEATSSTTSGPPAGKTAAELAVEAAKEGVYSFDKLWGTEIYAYQQWDKRNSFPKNAVLFVGSSSTKLWDTTSYFPEWKVINRGFGGADIKAVNYYFDKVVTPYNPSTIVLYAGDNEISRGGKSWVVCEDFKVFYKLCSEKVPDAEIIFISVKLSKLRKKFWKTTIEANSLIEEYCKTKPNAKYIDLAGKILDDDGIPVDKFFNRDRLHLSKAGYRLWTDQLKPLLPAPNKKPAVK